MATLVSFTAVVSPTPPSVTLECAVLSYCTELAMPVLVLLDSDAILLLLLLNPVDSDATLLLVPLSPVENEEMPLMAVLKPDDVEDNRKATFM